MAIPTLLGVETEYAVTGITRDGSAASHWRVNLPDPLGATRADLEATFLRSGTLEELLESMGAEPEPRPPQRQVALVKRAWWTEAVLANHVASPTASGPGNDKRTGDQDETP